MAKKDPNFGLELRKMSFTRLQHTGGILFANRNEGQFSSFFERIG
jgi:hypothetical protein